MNTPYINNKLLQRPFQAFFNKEAGSGVLLILCTIVALVWANSGLSDYYVQLWNTYIVVGAGSFSIDKPLLLWINDGLMAIFFFVVGLEIKRELFNGELSSPRKAALPFAAAVGGAVIPAAIYLGFNAGSEAVQGWAVPMATDIAFALGVLAMLGSRAPFALKIFVTALAIVDDLIAILVIAVFYTAEISLLSLGIGIGLIVVCWMINRFGIYGTTLYIILGVAAWVAFLKSGVHATVAGVLVAMTIPAQTKIDTGAFLNRSMALIESIKSAGEQNNMPTADQRTAIHNIEMASIDVLSPLQRLEHSLHGWVAYGIMPVFALANAGVVLSADVLNGLVGNGVFWGIFLGLLLGKPLGIFASTWIVVRTNLAELPEGITWKHLFGGGALAGIGFTMALFIANLAFTDAATLETAKLAILVASLTSAILGWWVLSSIQAAPPEEAYEGEGVSASVPAES